MASAPPLASYPSDLGRETRSTAGLAFPLVLTFPAPGEWTGHTGQGGIGTRTYQVEVLFAPGTTLTAAQLVSFGSLLQALGTAYVSTNKLPGGADVLAGDGAITDAGLVIINYAGLEVYGTEFRIRVLEA